MELNVETFDSFIKQQCRDILEHSVSLMPFFKDLSYHDKSKTDRLMIQLTLSVQNLCKIAFPTPASAEFFGMPKEATDAADDPDVIVVDKENPDWDFKPWFQEKTNNIREGYQDLLEYYEKNPRKFALAPNAGISSEQYLKERLEREIQTIEAYAEAILSMFESGRLTVKDVRLDDEVDARTSVAYDRIIKGFETLIAKVYPHLP